MSTALLDRLREYGVIPVIAIENADAALGLADALIAGDLPVAEITFRTTAAADVIRTLAAQRPNLIVGAGTVLSVKNLELAEQCGAQFGVAPGTNPSVVKRAAELGMPFVPGIATPSEVEEALELGCKHLKFFPAEACGGLAMLKGLSAPYKHTGVQFVPTGGVKQSNLTDYLSIETVAAVGGTWIATQEDIATGNWAEVTRKCRDARAVVQQLRD